MVPKKVQFVLILILLLSQSILAQNAWLNVQDPQQTWRSYRGNINEAIVSVGQRGLYSQVSMYLTFSADAQLYQSGSQLEVVMNFNLPPGSIVTDLWLWIGDKISKGALLDVWTASSIYESIVNRRRDPALLRRMYDDNYELRVYPMLPNETRKVRVTYLVPNTWTLSKVSTPLPVNILKASGKKIPSAYIKTWTDHEWTSVSSPIIPGLFSPMKDDFFGTHFELNWDSYQNQQNVFLEFNNPMVNGVYLKVFKGTTEGYYQLSILPSNSLTGNSKKVLFLIDYDSRKSSTTRKDILTYLKSYMKDNLDDNDKVNLFYSGLTIGKVSQEWLSAGDASVDAIFSAVGENSISTYSNLPTLLKEAYEYMSKNTGGVVFLISNSDQLGSNITGNQVIADLRKIMPTLSPTYILDYNDREFTYYYFNTRSYVGNEYFFDNLSRLTGGQYSRVNGGFTTSLNKLGGSLSGSINSFDLYTTLQNGFCFSRQTISENTSTMPINSIVAQVGKYVGEFPFLIKTSGIYNAEPFTQNVVFENSVSRVGDQTTQSMWVNSYIKSLERGDQTNSVISEIINVSRAYRVLSRYTAFLSVEDDSAICLDCLKDEGALIGVEDEVIPTEFSMSAYPNPFNPQTTITIKLTAQMLSDDLTFRIYNVLGQVVKTFTIDEIGKGNVITLTWNGLNDTGEKAASGVYIFTVSGKNFTKTLKLMMLK